jgi:hypothetical protein
MKSTDSEIFQLSLFNPSSLKWGQHSINSETGKLIHKNYHINSIDAHCCPETEI